MYVTTLPPVSTRAQPARQSSQTKPVRPVTLPYLTYSQISRYQITNSRTWSFILNPCSESRYKQVLRSIESTKPSLEPTSPTFNIMADKFPYKVFNDLAAKLKAAEEETKATKAQLQSL